MTARLQVIIAHRSAAICHVMAAALARRMIRESERHRTGAGKAAARCARRPSHL
jgi:hypothetical protein